MAAVQAQRLTADLAGEFVVFLSGMRIDKPWKVHKWWPVARGMARMLRELDAHPEGGFMGDLSSGLLSVQYWRSFEQLTDYARSHDHWPAWVAFNKRVRQSRGDVGIWHETYRVAPEQYETVYSGMPPFGLRQLESARGRFAEGEM